MQLTNKDLIDFLTEIKDQLKNTMQAETLPERDLDMVFEKLILSHLDGCGLYEQVQDSDQVADYYSDLTTPDAEQDYDGSWHKV